MGCLFTGCHLGRQLIFCKLLLLITLWNSLIVSNNCSTDSLRFVVRSYANNDNLTASLMIFTALISFSYIIKLATSTRTVLNNSDDGGQPCVVLTVMEYSPLTVWLSLGLGRVNVHLLSQSFKMSRKHLEMPDVTVRLQTGKAHSTSLLQW